MYKKSTKEEGGTMSRRHRNRRSRTEAAHTAGSGQEVASRTSRPSKAPAASSDLSQQLSQLAQQISQLAQLPQQISQLSQQVEKIQDQLSRLQEHVGKLEQHQRILDRRLSTYRDVAFGRQQDQATFVAPASPSASRFPFGLKGLGNAGIIGLRPVPLGYRN